jgi:hypothetical protein
MPYTHRAARRGESIGSERIFGGDSKLSKTVNFQEASPFFQDRFHLETKKPLIGI